MEKTKIAIILTVVIALATVTIGLSFANNLSGNGFFGGMMDYPNHAEDEDWWTHMRDHMGESWDGIEDEEWFEDMRIYMDEHIAELESKEWFDEMIDFMDEHGYGNHMGFGYGGCH